jgi:hypothetical protein
MHAHEKAFFEAFVVPAKRDRCVELLVTLHGREKIRRLLDHFADLDPRSCRRIRTSEQNPADTLRLLRSLGAGRIAYVMSSVTDLDGGEMLLDEALNAVVGRGCGTVLSCLSGTLAYFESEERGERYVCQRE